jgi:hypothetical protein
VVFPCAVAPLYIKIFPEKDKSCHIRLLDDPETAQVCRKPMNYESTLMSLKDLVQGGFELADAKILVIVKSISTRKKGQCIVKYRLKTKLTRCSHEKRWNHSGTRKSRRDGRYKRSHIVVVGCHFDKPDGLAAFKNCAADHKS